ncbi:uncharacterized protein LOC124919671 isoform X2 [Impatiens glandulifera]|uniref:uncharacterized protein LOC124919671 isoform X2 n=1 Tax=Impatiens glandulifera TaxID=253017 RepID=UPI001FB122B0|nr:uncharacterized protein LOC124919671 isoform X2 [Impatiens glandulifera]
MPFKVAEDGDISGSDSDDGFDEDMEALRRACMLTGTNPDNLLGSASSANVEAHVHAPDGASAAPMDTPEVEEDEEDDFEILRNIQQRFSASANRETPISRLPLMMLPPASSDQDDDDFETLRAIQRRFECYDKNSLQGIAESDLDRHHDQAHNNNKTHNEVPLYESNVESSDINETPQSLELCDVSHKSETTDFATFPASESGFPKQANAFVVAIRKNRACQKLLRSKLIQIQMKIENNRKLSERVKILKDFQVSCKKQVGKALSQKKDARIQLIAVPKPRPNQVGEKKALPLICGPIENAQVCRYRKVLEALPASLSREKWSEEERQNLAKGVKQQFQELLLKKSVDLLSDSQSYVGDSNDVDSIITSIRDLEITPENIRSFLPKVNWERLASMYFPGRRSGPECEARWLNCEDPLINNHSWTTVEDKKLLHIIQQNGVCNWIDIAVSLGTNRTPFQCLTRYQRSLNASIMKREWTEEEDEKLRAAVETYGESNWQSVAYTLEGRTGTQCSNRWMKTLHPARQRVGIWTEVEDVRLDVTVRIFGPKNWKRIAELVGGRTQVQCRERWFNSLDPSLNKGKWNEEEDSRLLAAMSEHGHCWSKVAASMPGRTDSLCRRRWKLLLPHEVPLLQEAKMIQKVALISNFVDRESERPALGPTDFVLPSGMKSISQPENVRNKKPIRSRKISNRWEASSILAITNKEDKGSKRTCKPQPRKKKCVLEEDNASLETTSTQTPGEASTILAITNEEDKGSKITRKPRQRKETCVLEEGNVSFGTTSTQTPGEASIILSISNEEDKGSKRTRKPRQRKEKCVLEEGSVSFETTSTQTPREASSILAITNEEDKGSKRTRKPRQRKEKCVLEEGSVSFETTSTQTPGEASSILAITNEEDKGSKRTRKPRQRKEKCVLEEDNTSLETTLTQTPGENITLKVPKQRKRKDKCVQLTNKASTRPEKLPTRRCSRTVTKHIDQVNNGDTKISGENIENLGDVIVYSRKRKLISSPAVAEHCSEPPTHDCFGQGMEGNSSEPPTHDCFGEGMEGEVEDDTTLACFIGQRKPTIHHAIMKGVADDDMTLGCFIDIARNKRNLKRRRRH